MVVRHMRNGLGMLPLSLAIKPPRSDESVKICATDVGVPMEVALTEGFSARAEIHGPFSDHMAPAVMAPRHWEVVSVSQIGATDVGIPMEVALTECFSTRAEIHGPFSDHTAAVLAPRHWEVSVCQIGTTDAGIPMEVALTEGFSARAATAVEPRYVYDIAHWFREKSKKLGLN